MKGQRAPTDDTEVANEWEYKLLLKKFRKISLDFIPDFSDKLSIEPISKEIGKGVKAKEPLPKDEIIGFYHGKVKHLSSTTGSTDHYEASLGGGYVLSAKDITDHFSPIINGCLSESEIEKYCLTPDGKEVKSDDLQDIGLPNVRFEPVSYELDGKLHVGVIIRTTEDIKKGEQLLLPYGITYFYGMRFVPAFFDKEGQVLDDTKIIFKPSVRDFIDHLPPPWLREDPNYRNVTSTQTGSQNFFSHAPSSNWDLEENEFCFVYNEKNPDKITLYFKISEGELKNTISSKIFNIEFNQRKLDNEIVSVLTDKDKTFRDKEHFLEYCKMLKSNKTNESIKIEKIKREAEETGLLRPDISNMESCRDEISKNPMSLIIYRPEGEPFVAIGLTYRRNNETKHQTGVLKLEEVSPLTLNNILKYAEHHINLKLQFFDFIRESDDYLIDTNKENAKKLLDEKPYVIVDSDKNDKGIFCILYKENDQIKESYICGSEVAKIAEKIDPNNKKLMLDELINRLNLPQSNLLEEDNKLKNIKKRVFI
ncbi:SET domain-containing protein-lysine N-methyltransferase [Legionella brunensis]|uniref:SET domain-containing protein n=1 Tax=Legionella brunensis TaxID=29422 RepID=A0A0W0SEH3_9GAMM|nr:SET domain-containing protein-lysine N-methyltransferase [Legionella brunensis]KTC81762.1 hypothetical protein Lbru_1752 [Legionella brunensis]